MLRFQSIDRGHPIRVTMAIQRVGVLLLLIFLFSACGPVQQPCDASTCNGCCDMRGMCQCGDGTLGCAVQATHVCCCVHHHRVRRAEWVRDASRQASACV